MLKARPEGVRMDGSLRVTAAAATLMVDDDEEEEEEAEEEVQGKVLVAGDRAEEGAVKDEAA